jgi:formate dehydrogenase subunit gamma
MDVHAAPDGPTPAGDEARLAPILALHAATRGGLLPLLHDIQAEYGCVPDALVPRVAAALNLSRAEVHGVITFYHDFRREPAGRHVVRLCRAESCQARGGAEVEEQAVALLQVGMGATRGDGQVTLEPVYCLGLCAIGPNALVDGVPVAGLDAAKLRRVAAMVAA